MLLTLISLAAILLFVTGTPILLIMIGWVVATSYFVADISLSNVGIGAIDTITSFVFLSVPLFIATGDFLTEGGISKRLINFARSLTAIFPGRTAAAAIVSSGMFAAVSGSNSATAATVGRMLNEEMTKTGMKKSLVAAIVASGGIVGVIVPPSVIFVVYGVTVNVSTIDLFIGGIIPGLVLVLAMLLTVMVLARKTEPGVGLRGFSPKTIGKTAAQAWLGFIAIGLIFFGVYDGLFSPTEAAGIVALFCLFAGMAITRQIKLRNVPSIMMRSAAITGLIVPLVAFSTQFQQVLGALDASQAIQSLLNSIGTNYGVIVAVGLMLLLILLVGAMTESVAVVLILGPILAPVAAGFGIDPVHWGVVFVVGTAIGFITPPYGLNLFVVSAVCKVPFGQVMRSIWIMLIPLMLAWLLITVSPWMTSALQPVK
jgi:C4-dicarboxylate transporter DctM subunit